MSEIPNNNPAPTGGQPTPGTPAPQEPPRTFTQDDFNALDAKLKREYKEKLASLEEKAKLWDQKTESEKSEAQREREAKAKVEAELNSLKLERDREKWQTKFGKKYNIPESDRERLRGSTEEEIETDAKAWAKARGLDKAGGPTPPGAAPSGRSPFNQAILDATGRGGR